MTDKIEISAAVTEEAARQIDPDAFSSITDGHGAYWMGRRRVAMEKGRAAITAAIKAHRSRDARVLEEREACAGAIGHKISELEAEFGVCTRSTNLREAALIIRARNGGENAE